jgi:hypothetical protein
MAHSNNADLLSFSILRQMSPAAVYQAMSMRGKNTSPEPKFVNLLRIRLLGIDSWAPSTFANSGSEGHPNFEFAYLISV